MGRVQSRAPFKTEATFHVDACGCGATKHEEKSVGVFDRRWTTFMLSRISELHVIHVIGEGDIYECTIPVRPFGPHFGLIERRSPDS